MHSVFDKIFDDSLLITTIQSKLPNFFQLAEMESQRNGKIGMEVGSARERILIALLIYKFGLDAVDANLPITEPEIDVIVDNEPLSIKTVTTTSGKWNNGIKLIWSVDAGKALAFQEDYSPKCDILLAQIQWEGYGFLYLFHKDAQTEILEKLGKASYMVLPKKGTNARGVELSVNALELLAKHKSTRKIEIFFNRNSLDYREVYTKWLEAWGD